MAKVSFVYCKLLDAHRKSCQIISYHIFPIRLLLVSVRLSVMYFLLENGNHFVDANMENIA